MGSRIAIIVLDDTKCEERSPEHMAEMLGFRQAIALLARNRGLMVVDPKDIEGVEITNMEGGTVDL